MKLIINILINIFHFNLTIEIYHYDSPIRKRKNSHKFHKYKIILSKYLTKNIYYDMFFDFYNIYIFKIISVMIFK